MGDKIKDLWLTFVVDVWEPIADFFRNIKWFFHNLNSFKKCLWDFRDWDHYYCTMMFTKSLQELAKRIKDGNEEEISRMKKYNAIMRLVDLLKYDPEDDNDLIKKYLPNGFLGLDERCNMSDEDIKEYRSHLREYDLSVDKAKKDRLKEIFSIIKGQSNKELDIKKESEELKKTNPEDYKRQEANGFYDLYVEKFDGTGYEGWWE